MKLTISREEYLNAIYTLTLQKPTVRITDIANYLKVQKPSVNTAINNLKIEGLVNYEKYKEVTLTKKGFFCAKHIYKRHEIFKKFLTEILKVEESLVEKEANQLAHCVSCHTTAKLETFICELLKNKE